MSMNIENHDLYEHYKLLTCREQTELLNEAWTLSQNTIFTGVEIAATTGISYSTVKRMRKTRGKLRKSNTQYNPFNWASARATAKTVG